MVVFMFIELSLASCNQFCGSSKDTYCDFQGSVSDQETTTDKTKLIKFLGTWR